MSADRPEFCTDEMLLFLDELRGSGAANMGGAGRDLDESFPELTFGTRSHHIHSSEKARQVLNYWMHTARDHRKPVPTTPSKTGEGEVR